MLRIGFELLQPRTQRILVNPKIAIPMHFWWEQAVQEYADGMAKVKTLNTPVLKISKPELPTATEVVILPWRQR